VRAPPRDPRVDPGVDEAAVALREGTLLTLGRNSASPGPRASGRSRSAVGAASVARTRPQWACGPAGVNVLAHCRENADSLPQGPPLRATVQPRRVSTGSPSAGGAAKDAHGEGPSGAVQHVWSRPRCRMEPLHAGSRRVGDTTCCYTFRLLALPKPRVVGSSPTGGASLFADFASSSSAAAPRGAAAQSRRALARLFSKSSEPKPAPSNVQVAGSGMRKSPGPAPM